MTTFTEFCKHYELNQEAPDSLIQYEQYRDAYRMLSSFTGNPRHAKQPPMLVIHEDSP